MPLFEIAIIEPAVGGANPTPETLILPPTPVLAPDVDGAKALGTHAASKTYSDMDPARVARWRVLARPFT